MRTNAARLHLRPSPELNARILAVIGRALVLYPVMLHAFVFLSNHWHALATACDGEALSKFLQYVHSNVAKAAQQINGVQGKVWGREASIIPVLDDEAQLQRLAYLLAHGTKESLVASPLDWPGVSSARALALGERLVGEWVDRSAKRRLERGGKRVHPAQYTTYYPIELAPLPAQERMSTEARREEVQRIVAEIVVAHPGPHLGVASVLMQDSNAQPMRSKRSTPPPVHTTSPRLRRRYLRLYDAFMNAYRATAERHAKRPTTVEWPIDAFLPARTYVSAADSPPLMRMIL